ncbi:MAG: hypothetical protein IT165_06555 [Bryobacterales bacterium]|nr:hypothetical protein [Bryobacterales bacterium]
MAERDADEIQLAPDAIIWSMRGTTKTCRLVVLDAKTPELARARAEDHLVQGGLSRDEAEERLDHAHRQVAALENGIFSFWTDR